MYVENLQKAGHEFLHVDVLAKTILGRSVEILTITDPKNMLVDQEVAHGPDSSKATVIENEDEDTE